MAIHGKKLTFSQRGGWWVVGQALLLLLILFLPDPLFSSDRFSSSGYYFIGGTLIAAALLILWSGAKSLRKALTPYPYPLENAQLIREGIYRFVRHPLYLGVIVGGFGVSIWRRNILSLGCSLILGFFLNAKANREEAWLSQKFPEYKAYRQKTRKLIPFIY